MFCINCLHSKTNVTNSRPHKKQPTIWRRRSCSQCGTVFTTTERVAVNNQRNVVGDNDAQTPFNLGQLIISIAQSFSHSPTQAKSDSLYLAQTVETTLVAQTRGDITTDQVAHTTYSVLKKYDELAAVQYAAKHQLISSLRKRGRPSLASPAQQSRQSPSR